MTSRRKLPFRRAGETLELGCRFPGYSALIGRFDDGSPAEIFINSGRPTSGVADVARDGGVLISIALQWGVPLKELKAAITRLSDGTAATVIGAALDLVGDNNDFGDADVPAPSPNPMPTSGGAPGADCIVPLIFSYSDKRSSP